MLEMKYFVLKPRSKFAGDPFAEAARSAMRKFAQVIACTDARLAEELRAWVEREERRETENRF